MNSLCHRADYDGGKLTRHRQILQILFPVARQNTWHACYAGGFGRVSTVVGTAGLALF